jgi:hypothetical protein
MSLIEALQIARSVLHGNACDPYKKAQAIQKIAGLHAVLTDLKSLDGEPK